MRTLICLALLAAAPVVAQNARILPVIPLAEPVETGQDLNFDILVKNDGGATLTLNRLEVRYFDPAGNELWHRACDGSGASPCLETIPNREVKPGEEQLWFNPFPHLAASLDVRTIEVKLGLDAGSNQSRDLTARAQLSSRQPARILVPLAGRIRAWDGHDALAHHRRWNYALPFLRGLGFTETNGMRYSYDFVVDGAPEAGNTIGLPVRAVANGTVTSMVMDHADDRSFDPEATRVDVNALFGNYLVVDHGDGTFALYGHLQRNSSNLRPGDRVKRGARIANVGESGSAAFPHLHFQLMDGRDMRAEGIPALFRDFTRLRGPVRERVAVGAIGSGDVIEAR